MLLAAESSPRRGIPDRHLSQARWVAQEISLDDPLPGWSPWAVKDLLLTGVWGGVPENAFDSAAREDFRFRIGWDA